MKRFMVWLLVSALSIVGLPLGVPATAATTQLQIPSFFSDGMIFEQNKPMNLWGKAPAGCVVKAQLYCGKELLETCSVTVSGGAEWNKWQLSFSARKGSYDTYEIRLFANNNLCETISNVVVGILWLANGQSNMEFRLDWAVGGAQEVANAKDSFLRVLLMPGDPTVKNAPHPATPNFDIAGCRWGQGNQGTDISGMSATAYFAAKRMRQELNVPVGIINAALGSTSIQTWLSRESIEGNTAVKTALKRANLYKTQEEMATASSGDYQTLTAMYNVKIGPLAGMNLSGVLWCQGETNRDGKPNSEGFYTQALLALAEGYSKTFEFSNGSIPILVINIASHPYNSDAQNIPKWIEEVAAASEQRATIMNVPIYDVPLTYQNPPSPTVAYPIHPNNKRQPGERAAMMALHNLYGMGNADCYAPTVKAYTIQENAIYITFDHIAQGLTTLNNSKGVHGFTIAGDDKLYAPAYATIENNNTVKIWNDGISNPTRFTYAFNSHAQTANLCNSYFLPAVPYRSHSADSTLFASNDWLYCEDTSVFVNTGLKGDFEPTWHSYDLAETIGEISVETADVYEGTGAIRLGYQANEKITIGAAANFGYHLMPLPLYKYEYVSVMLKNNDAREKTVRLLVGKKGETKGWMLPAATQGDSLEYTVTLPANAPYTRYTFRVRDLLGYGIEEAAPLTQLSCFAVMVEDDANGSICIDSISLGTEVPRKETPLTQGNPLVCYGDVNADEKIDAKDALHILQNAVGKREFNQQQFTAGNVNGDEKIDAKDALLVLKKAVNRIEKFPVE